MFLVSMLACGKASETGPATVGDAGMATEAMDSEASGAAASGGSPSGASGGSATQTEPSSSGDGAAAGEGGGARSESGVADADASADRDATTDRDAGASVDPGAMTDSGASDAPYADVTNVSASGSSGTYTFSVSVQSADIDCSQYADWWEVLAEDGSLLFRRILEHSHTDENGTTDPDAPGNTFTRSGGPVSIAEDGVVIVRAHMSTGGYNGMAMMGSVAGGFAAAPQIGSDFAAEVEALDPQPSGCLF
jgi:hypothetical protein